MIIKDAYGSQADLEVLEGLSKRIDCSAENRKRIELEMKKVRAGMQGEREAAYEMKVRWGESKNWMVIHDLRLEVQSGVFMQMDHVVINRLLEIYVCESKHYSEGVSINEHGEFTGFFNGRPYGVASPIAQNQRHLMLLRRFLDEDGVIFPTRLGYPLDASLKSVVLVSKNARISRPRAKIEGLETVIKMDQLFDHIEKLMDSNSVFNLVKLIGPDSLESFARQLASKHVPLMMNWAAKFGLSDQQPLDREGKSQSLRSVQDGAEKCSCHGCGVEVERRVARFCSFYKSRFGGKVYCRDCQVKQGQSNEA